MSSTPSGPESSAQPASGSPADTLLAPPSSGVPDSRRVRGRRKIRLPVILFLLTCFSTYSAGCYQWFPVMFGSPWYAELKKGETYIEPDGKLAEAKKDGPVQVNWRSALRKNWRDGLTYMVCVMAALLFHEMGHFLMALRHRVRASLPFFIPFPVMVTGTMGAVIGMDPYKANRKEVFDIGLAGPLAGLVVIVPLVIYGLMTAEPVPVQPNMSGYGDPLLVKLLIPVVRDIDQMKAEYAEEHDQPEAVNMDFTFQINAIYMAGWVGMLVTGVNMMPVSQLDGGHVLFGLLGTWSRYAARGFLIAAIAAIIWFDAYQWTLMIILVMIIHPDHPPTADDTVKLGPLRWMLGFVSLSIPILCFTPFPFQFP
ncbi:MAG: site-2 protease family protein [Pirellulales bacterium]